MKIIDQLKKVNLIQFVPAIFVISLVGNSVFGYTAPKSEKSTSNPTLTKNTGINTAYPKASTLWYTSSLTFV